MSTRKLVSASTANLLIPISGLLVSPFLSRELGPEGRGLYAALTLPIVVCGWIGTYGLQDALSYHVREGRLSRRAAAKVSLVAMAPLGVLAVGLMAVLGLFIFPDPTRHGQFLTLALFAPLHVLANLFIGALTGGSDIRGLNLVKVVPALVRTALVIFCCLAFDLSAYQAGLIFIGSVLTGLVIGLVRLRSAVEVPSGESAPPDPVPTGSLIRYALTCLPGVLAAISSARLDQVVGLPLIGARELGYYAVAVSLAELPMVVATAARTVLMGRPAGESSRDTTQVARLAVLASVVICGLLALSAGFAVPLVFGADFTPAVAPTVILCAGTLLYACMTIYSAALLAHNRPGWSSAALVTGSVVGILALLALAPLGAVGAALASLAGYAVAMIIAGVAVGRVPALGSLRMLTVPYEGDVRLVKEKVARMLEGVRPTAAAVGGGADKADLPGTGSPATSAGSPVSRAVALYRRIGPGTTGVAVLIVLAWTRVLAPQVMQLVDTGRPAFNSREDLVPPLGEAAGNGLTLLFLLLAAGLGVHGLWRRRPAGWRWLAVGVAPLLAVEVAGLLHGQTPGPVAVALPLAAFAIWAQRPREEVLGVIGVLGGLTALVSMVFAAARPDLALISGAAAGEKSVLLGGLLAGPYLHSNVLGIALALSVAFVFHLRHPGLRWTCLALILAALLWTGSRTSQLAVGAVLLTYVLLRLFRHRSWPASVTLAAGALLVVVVPLITTDPESFSERGRIWAALLDRWRDSPIVGWGPKLFQQDPALAAELGGQFNHGHNVMVQLLVVGGLLALVAFGLLCWAAWRRSAMLAAQGRPAALLFLVGLVHVSWLEASHIPTTLSGYVTWLPLLTIALAGPTALLDAPASPARPGAASLPGSRPRPVPWPAPDGLADSHPDTQGGPDGGRPTHVALSGTTATAGPDDDAQKINVPRR
ncbi:O-antigen ligase family protein [Micromonospora coxensis]|uniref:Membrane protein involved in the export of O-antigen and teichoic acid n=1 Tax=Micromonospora coxensis TaxID=356852 RepID=A0A1C5JDN0_9ACTN|nr:O-antigen ligase family protein [Micromonospora coxensis]SCG68642.1 Membrane protein involved in the export of O-antigen and teichoic acid [Micromonospora coxensis]